MKKILLWTSFCVLVPFCLTSCKSGGGTAIMPPVSNAGNDKNVLAGWTVTLDGSGSRNASIYSWALTEPAGSTAVLSNSRVSNPTFTADKAGSYVLSLVVSNGSVSSSPDTVTIMAVNPRLVPDTGQVTVYAAGDDSTYSSNTPSYSDNNDGTITDNVTNLVWQKCAVGQDYLDCWGSPDSYNWYQASGTADAIYNNTGIDICGNLVLGGSSEWRLPTEFELLTLVDYSGNFAPDIDTTMFGNSKSGPYWSSATNQDPFNTATDAWYQFLSGGVTWGATGYQSKTMNGKVRCVRAEQSVPVFTDNGDGTITDNVTGLIWQKQADETGKTWTQALNYCDGLTLAGSANWRVPNIKELRSIVDTTNFHVLDSAYFNNLFSAFWSSSTRDIIPTQAWIVFFSDGEVGDTDKASAGGMYVRCVR